MFEFHAIAPEISLLRRFLEVIDARDVSIEDRIGERLEWGDLVEWSGVGTTRYRPRLLNRTADELSVGLTYVRPARSPEG